MTRLLKSGGALLALAALLLVACGGEDRPKRPNVEVIGGSDTVSVSSDSVAPDAGGTPVARPAVAPGKYVPSSNVDSYFAMSADLKDIRAALNAATPNFAAAGDLYTKGKNQTLANGTVRGLASMPNDSVQVMFPNGAAVYGRPNFIDAIVRDGLAGTGRAAGLPDAARRQIVDKGVLMLFYGKAMQEFTAAKTRLDSGAASPGVPVDETWSIIAGIASGTTYPDSILAVAAQRERDFKLDGKLAAPLEASLANALAAAEQGNKPAFEKAFTDARGYLNAVFYLSVLRDAKQLESASTQPARQEALAEGWGFWQTIRALSASGSASAAQTVETAFSGNGSAAWVAADTTRVYAALNDSAVLQALGIPSALQVKTPPTP